MEGRNEPSDIAQEKPRRTRLRLLRGRPDRHGQGARHPGHAVRGEQRYRRHRRKGGGRTRGTGSLQSPARGTNRRCGIAKNKLYTRSIILPYMP